MAARNRRTLKEQFKKGVMPSQASFEDLIDSMVNKYDDGFSKGVDHGLMLSPEGSSKRLLSFYRSLADNAPSWAMELRNDNAGKGLFLGECDKEPSLFLLSGGNVGIGTAAPAFTLDVNGIAAMRSRIGTFAKGEVPGNGKWHTIKAGLTGCHALEVIAGIGRQGEGKYALLHATALSTYGNSHSTIKKVQAYYGWWWNKLCIRWTGSTYDYSLQVKTRRNYGDGMNIKYHITSLWSDAEMGMPMQTLETKSKR